MNRLRASSDEMEIYIFKFIHYKGKKLKIQLFKILPMKLQQLKPKKSEKNKIKFKSEINEVENNAETQKSQKLIL